MKEHTMGKTLKLLCLAILPSLSFAADQATGAVDFFGYSLTQKVLAAYFKANESDASTSKNTVWTEHGSEITISKLKPESSIVAFKFKTVALSDCEDNLASAIVEMLKSKGCEGVFYKDYELDNGIVCKYKFSKPSEYHQYKSRYEHYVSCHGSISRELFDAMKKNAEKIEAVEQQADKASE